MGVIDYIAKLPRDGEWPLRSQPVDSVCIHHSATSPFVSLEAIARYHLSKGHPGIQYHYVIAFDGKVFQVNEDNRNVYHSHYWDTGIGVCMLGNFSEALPTKEQLQAAQWLYFELRKKHGAIPLVGHNTPRNGKVANTQCPGTTFGRWKWELVSEPIDNGAYLLEKAKAHQVPYNEDTALAKAGKARGFVAISDEYRDVVGYVYQLFRHPLTPSQLQVGWVVEGKWDDVYWVADERK